MKKAFLFNKNNEFVCEVNAQLDVLATEFYKKEIYILPANATFEPVLDKKDGYTRKFDGKQWYYEEIIIPQPEPQPELTYQDLRVAEYPAIGDQLDMIYWDKINNTNKWVETITEIKNKYPKE